MPVVAIRKTAWNAGNESQRWAMRLAGRKVELGQPALYRQSNNTQWHIFSDQGITALDVAILGTVAAGLAQYPNWTVPADKQQARDEIYDFVKANIVLPKDIAYTHLVDVQVEDWEWRTATDELGNDYQYRFYLGTFHTEQVEEPLGDTYDLTLAAQGAPVWIAARESIPAGLSPVEVAA